MQVMWEVDHKRVALTALEVVDVEGNAHKAVELGDNWWGLGWAEPVETPKPVEVQVLGVPRFVDNMRWEELAVQLEPDAARRLSAMVNDTRNWSDLGMNRVNDEFGIVAMCSPTKNRWMAVQVRFLEKARPGTFGTWQRGWMDRWEAESYVEAACARDAEHCAFQWASQWQQQLVYDLEGVDGGELIQSVYENNWQERLRTPSKVTPVGRHPGWERPPSAWKVTKLAPSRPWRSSPYAGMRNHGTDPLRDGEPEAHGE